MCWLIASTFFHPFLSVCSLLQYILRLHKLSRNFCFSFLYLYAQGTPVTLTLKSFNVEEMNVYIFYH